MNYIEAKRISFQTFFLDSVYANDNRAQVDQPYETVLIFNWPDLG